MTNIASLRSILLASSMSMLAQPVFADDTAANEDTSSIVVTGIRQAYRGDFAQKEIPQAISTITTKQLEENNILRLTDALDLNASVSRQNNFGGLWDSFAVRGFAGDENLPSGYLVNGFNGGRGFGGTRDVAGIERIEILKGPSAALFGRGEPGGTVNIVTKRAEFDSLKGSASGLYGSFDRIRFDADGNIPIGDNFAVRLVGYSEKSDSFRDTLDSKRYGFLPSVSARLGEDTTISYDLEYARANTDFDRGIPVVNGQLGTLPRSRFLGEPGDGPIRTEVLGHQLQVQHDFSDDWSLLLGGSYRDTKFGGFASFAELAGSRQRLTQDGRSLSRQRRDTRYDSEHFVVRGELAGDFELGGLRHRVLLGGDYDTFQNDQFLSRYRPPALSSNPSRQVGNVIDVFNPVYGAFPLPAATAIVTNRLDRQKAAGIYLQDQVSISDAVQIRFGLRYDDFSLRIQNRANSTTASRKDNRISPQFGIVVKASEAVSLYAAYGSGFRSNVAITPALSTVAPETSKSFEAGAKFSLFESAITGTVAAFALSKRNVLTADLANPGFSSTIGKAGSSGIEIDLAGKLPGGIDLLLSYAYVDAKAKADVLDPNFSLQIRSGDPLINIPKHSFNMQLSKRIAIGDNALTLGSGVQHVGRRLGETATTFFLPKYTLVRTFANFELVEGLEVFGDIKNLFNETHYTNSFSRLWVAPGAPRTATVGARVRF